MPLEGKLDALRKELKHLERAKYPSTILLIPFVRNLNIPKNMYKAVENVPFQGLGNFELGKH